MLGDSLESQAVILCLKGRLAEGLMRPRERRETGEQDLFRSRLDQIIDGKHALVKLARTIDWGWRRNSAPFTRMARASHRCRRG
jgi:hypothetical protein